MTRAGKVVVASVLALLFIGLVMRVSRVVVTRGPAEVTPGQVIMEIIPAIVGGLFMFGRAIVPAERLRRISPYVVLAGLVLLLLALIPGLRNSGPVNFPPSELAVMIAVIFLAWWLTHPQYPTTTTSSRCITFKRFLVAALFLDLEFALLTLQPHYRIHPILGITEAFLRMPAGQVSA